MSLKVIFCETNINIVQTQIHNAIFLNMKFDFIITLTYALMDNFCPYLQLVLMGITIIKGVTMKAIFSNPAGQKFIDSYG